MSASRPRLKSPFFCGSPWTNAPSNVAFNKPPHRTAYPENVIARTGGGLFFFSRFLFFAALDMKMFIQPGYLNVVDFHSRSDKSTRGIKPNDNSFTNLALRFDTFYPIYTSRSRLSFAVVSRTCPYT